jgi:hypothetical protein
MTPISVLQGFGAGTLFLGLALHKSVEGEHLYIKCIILPRQARDKHRESTQKEWRFLTFCSFCAVFLTMKTSAIVFCYQDRLGTNALRKAHQMDELLWFFGWYRRLRCGRTAHVSTV